MEITLFTNESQKKKIDITLASGPTLSSGEKSSASQNTPANQYILIHLFFGSIYFDLSPQEKEGSTYSLALVNQVSQWALTVCQHAQSQDLWK